MDQHPGLIFWYVNKHRFWAYLLDWSVPLFGIKVYTNTRLTQYMKTFFYEVHLRVKKWRHRRCCPFWQAQVLSAGRSHFFGPIQCQDSTTSTKCVVLPCFAQTCPKNGRHDTSSRNRRIDPFLIPFRCLSTLSDTSLHPLHRSARRPACRTPRYIAPPSRTARRWRPNDGLEDRGSPSPAVRAAATAGNPLFRSRGGNGRRSVNRWRWLDWLDAKDFEERSHIQS